MSLTALEGQGGIGKTRLALEYVRQHGASAFPGGVFWFSGEQDAEAQFHEMLRRLAPDKPWPGLVEMRQAGPYVVRGAFARELESLGERVLWVVDNLPEPVEGSPVDLDDWRIELGCLSILFTARTRVLFGAGGVASITVPSLDEEAALAMLLANRADSLSDEQRERAETIVEAVGRLPLAIEILASELDYSSLDELAHALVSEESSAVVDRVMRSLEEYVAKDSLRGVVQTFVRSYDRLDKSTRELAHLLACFGPEPIPRSLVEALGEPVDQLRGNLRTLQTRHFLTVQDPEKNVIGQVHRVLASFLRILRVDQSQRGALTRARDALLHDWRVRGVDGISRERAVLEPHVEAWCGHLSRFDVETGDVDLWLELGVHWYRRGLFKKAKPHQEQAHAFALRVLGERHPSTLTSMNDLGLTLLAMSELEQAKKLQEGVLGIRREELGERHPSTLTSKGNLALTYRMMGEFKQARALQEEDLKICREELGERHSHAVASIGNLALTLWEMGELNQAKELLEEALEIGREVSGERHPSTLTSMNNLAGILRAMGKLEQAKKLQEGVLEIRREELGERHPSTLTSKGNLAGMLRDMDEFEQAQEIEEEVLKTRLEVLGERHPSTLTSMNNLAGILRAMGKLEQAKELLEEALEIGREVSGERHPSTLTSKGNLAGMLRDMGEFEQAKVLQEEVLGIFREELGERHLSTLTSMNNLAGMLWDLGEKEQAQELLAEVLEACNEELGEYHPNTLNSMESLAIMFQQSGEHERARELLDRRQALIADTD